MVVLPKFVYLFSLIPVLIKKSFFRSLLFFVQLISSFLWGNKNQKISATAPNFLHYYWSCNIHKLLYWINNSADEEQPAWVDKELGSSKISLHSLVCSQLPLSASKFTSNPVVTHSVNLRTYECIDESDVGFS